MDYGYYHAMKTAELRSECALLQAGTDILAEHLRTEDEIGAMQMVEFARDKLLEAYARLGGNQPGVGENTNAVYALEYEAMP